VSKNEKNRVAHSAGGPGGGRVLQHVNHRTAVLSGGAMDAAGGAVIGAVAGSAALGAAVGVGAGLLGGYLYDQHQKSQGQPWPSRTAWLVNSIKEKLMKFLTILTILGLSLAMAVGPALADGLTIVPTISIGQPNWVPVPGVPVVYYAPNSSVDIFRYRGSYYYQYGDRWYQGRGVRGPWSVVSAPPSPFYRIESPYFKTPPGWARGKKVGWHYDHYDPVPPGHLKNYGFDPGHGNSGHGGKWFRWFKASSDQVKPLMQGKHAWFDMGHPKYENLL
jgi:MFS family permease